MLMYYHADVLERLLFYGKPFAGALGNKSLVKYAKDGDLSLLVWRVGSEF